MHSAASFGSIALVVYILCGAALSYRLPANEIFGLQKRLACVEDDILLSLQQYSEDAVPFCSKYLTISVLTSTVSITARTSAYSCLISVASC